MAGSVVALDGTRQVSGIKLDPNRRTAQTLAPAMHLALQTAGWEPQQVDLVAVTQGPGSFTGLRIGVTTAKTFAYATGAAIVGVNTLAVIARQIEKQTGMLWVVLNAERDQVFAASFRRLDRVWQTVQETQILDNQTWLQSLLEGDCVAGPGLKNLKDQIPAFVVVADESEWTPQAAAVGLLGHDLFLAGQKSDWWSLLPNYFRESAAIEKARATAK